MTRSILDSVNGIGPKRKKALLKEFKSIKQMKSASVEELSKIVPYEVASNLYDKLHEEM